MEKKTKLEDAVGAVGVLTMFVSSEQFKDNLTADARTEVLFAVGALAAFVYGVREAVA